MPRAKRNTVNAFNVRAHLSPASLARVEAALEAYPGIRHPRTGKFVPFEVLKAEAEVRMAVVDRLSPGSRAWVYANGLQTFERYFPKVYAKARGIMRRTKDGARKIANLTKLRLKHVA